MWELSSLLVKPSFSYGFKLVNRLLKMFEGITTEKSVLASSNLYFKRSVTGVESFEYKSCGRFHCPTVFYLSTVIYHQNQSIKNGSDAAPQNVVHDILKKNTTILKTVAKSSSFCNYSGNFKSRASVIEKCLIFFVLSASEWLFIAWYKKHIIKMYLSHDCVLNIH